MPTRKKRSAAHKLFRPRNTSHAKRFTTAIKKIRAWQRANAKQLKIISGAFASAHSHFCRHAFHYFFNCFRSAYCHALCTSDVPFLRASVIAVTSQLVLARHQAGRKSFAGGSGGRPVPVVRARLVPRQLPPQPPYAGSGSRSTPHDQRCSNVHLTLTVCCLTL